MNATKRHIPSRANPNGRYAFIISHAVRAEAQYEIVATMPKTCGRVAGQVFCVCGLRLSRADAGECLACQDERWRLARSMAQTADHASRARAMQEYKQQHSRRNHDGRTTYTG